MHLLVGPPKNAPENGHCNSSCSIRYLEMVAPYTITKGVPVIYILVSWGLDEASCPGWWPDPNPKNLFVCSLFATRPFVQSHLQIGPTVISLPTVTSQAGFFRSLLRTFRCIVFCWVLLHTSGEPTTSGEFLCAADVWCLQRQASTMDGHRSDFRGMFYSASLSQGISGGGE